MNASPVRTRPFMRRAATCAVASLVLLTACEQPQWDDPAYISEQLEKGDPNARGVALGHLEGLSEEKQREVIPALTKVYLDKGPNQAEVINMLVLLRDPSAKDAYLEEVKTNAGGKAGAAAEALGEAKAKDAIPAMVQLLEKTDDPEVKTGILRGFSYMPDPAMVAPLVDILGLDPDNNPIALHAYACEVLGEVAQEKPQAFDDDARKALVRGVFLANMKSQDVSFECSLAVQQLGEPAVPLLINTWKGEFEPVQKLMMQYKFAMNRPKGVATTRLTTLQAKEAGPLFLEDIQTKKELPKSAITSRNKAISWLTMEGQTVSEEILGLGDLGHAPAKDALVRGMTGELDDEWEEIKNAVGLLLIVQLRQNSALALNRLGDRSAAPEILKAASNLDAFPDLIANAKAVAKQNNTDLPAVEELYSYNVVTAQAYANLGGPKAKGPYKEFLDGLEDAKMKKAFAKFMPALDVAVECAAKGSPKAQGDCYKGKLSSDDPVVREKAIYEITRLPSEVAAPILAEAITTKKLNTREIVTFGLYRHPSKAAADNIAELLEKEKDRTSKAHKLDRRRLQYLHAWLRNNS